MDSLVSKLQNEVGLTEEQAKKAMSCIRSYMIENDLVDWDNFFEAKARDVSEKAQKAWNELTGKTVDWNEKINDWADKANKMIKEARNKAADFIADKG